MKVFISLWHLSVIVYGAWCLFIFADYRQKLHQHYANIEERERRWLFWVVQGFMAISMWRLFAHLTDELLGTTVSNTLGIMSNYLTYLFVNSLVFICIRYSSLFSVMEKTEIATTDSLPFKEEHIRRIQAFMDSEQPHLLKDSPSLSACYRAYSINILAKTFSNLLMSIVLKMQKNYS
jgi:hypothetical protein